MFGRGKKMNQVLRIAIFAAMVVLLGWPTAQAQLPDDVRDVFTGLLNDLDSDLAAKFQTAIANDTATVEFTPEQFRRFRADPVNPFDGLDEINAPDGGGNIALKFELPSLRERPMNPFERQHASMRENLRPVVGSAAPSVVRILNDAKQVALGIVVDRDGLILTKASEVEHEKTIVCKLPDGRSLPARIVRADTGNDIALLSVDAKDLTPVRWTTSQPLPGSFVLTPDMNGDVLTVGTYSSPPRSTVAGEQAFLGVQPQTTPQGVMITDVKPGAASYEAGLRDGDIISKLGEETIANVADLVRVIRGKRPGDSLSIEFSRDGVKQKAKASLGTRNMSGERAARFKMMSRLGTIPSRRGDQFPNVFQHDSPLFPEQCGGPLCDLQGNVLGMNIARGGRAASYAVPANHVRTVLEQLKRDSLAARAEQKKSRTN
jgi:S1-C subfamily serine protease